VFEPGQVDNALSVNEYFRNHPDGTLTNVTVRPELRDVVAAKLAEDWSPDQIARWLAKRHQPGSLMRVSHETIYKSLFIQSRGVLAKELQKHLRSQRPIRRSVHNTVTGQWRSQIADAVSIHQRPAEVADRVVPGRKEGDLLIGLERSAIGTVVERTTRFTTLVHLPREQGYRHKETIKNGPALAGYGALTMKNALATTMSTLPEQLVRSLTWDRGKEMSAHAQFRVETGIPVFFADPQSPWQRGTNENTVGCYASTSPRAPTCPSTTPGTCTRSRPSSTTDPARSSSGPHRTPRSVRCERDTPMLRR
jgi:IS30 family transposase